MFEEKDDTILARWLANELTAQELEAFEKTDQFLEYKLIADASNRFLKPDYNKDKLFNKILEQRDQSKNAKVIKLKPIIYSIAVACTILIVFGLLINTKTYSTGVGEQLIVTLPDGSKVNLNANSELQHSRFFWENNRDVDLEGEAFFDVEKGNTFNVVTDLGTVSVLGTEFNVRARQQTLNLQCFEGKVLFKDKNRNQATLAPGDAILVINGNLETQHISAIKPSWLNNISSFNNMTLASVLEELKTQYNITIKNKNVDLNQRFTGSFVHDSIETALETILIPMDIKYTYQNSVLEISID